MGLTRVRRVHDAEADILTAALDTASLHEQQGNFSDLDVLWKIDIPMNRFFFRGYVALYTERSYI